MAEWTPWDELEAERKGRWAAEAQRDRALELLREYHALRDFIPFTHLGSLGKETAAFLAEQETNDD